MAQVRKLESEADAAQKREAEAHRRVEMAHAAELSAVQERETAEAALRGMRATKRQRTADAAQVEAGAADATETWTVSRWRKHETEAQKRRAVPIDDSNVAELFPPRGDETRGWRRHWRRGLVGTLCDWAEGSRFRVAFMLAEMANHFECEQMVRTKPLNPSHPNPSHPHLLIAGR